jgi:hypothetical protein
MTETWYILEDGSLGDPLEIAPDKDGRLRHRDGRAVAYAPHGPRSRGGVDAAAERARYGSRDMKPEPHRRGYRTREAKAD